MAKKSVKKTFLSKKTLLAPGALTAKLTAAGNSYRNSDHRLKSRDLLSRLYRYYYFARENKIRVKLTKLLVSEHKFVKRIPLSSAMIRVALGIVDDKKLSKWSLMLERAWGQKFSPKAFLPALEKAGGIDEALASWR